MNKKQILLLPMNTILNQEEIVDYMEIIKNSSIKKFEINFFVKDKLVKNYILKNIVIQLIEDIDNKIILNMSDEESTDDNIRISLDILNIFFNSKNLINALII